MVINDFVSVILICPAINSTFSLLNTSWHMIPFLIAIRTHLHSLESRSLRNTSSNSVDGNTSEDRTFLFNHISFPMIMSCLDDVNKFSI